MRWRLALTAWAVLSTVVTTRSIAEELPPEKAVRSFLGDYCLSCHSAKRKRGELDFESVVEGALSDQRRVWETVARKLSARQMPPYGKDRPDEEEFERITRALEGILDRAAAKKPEPGRTDTFRRLNRTEYRNAIRDLLAIDVDTEELLPPDEASHGFDNVTVADLSPTLLDRYVSAAEKISRLAVGSPVSAPVGRTIRVPPDRTQEGHVDGLPFGTRGGVLVGHTFPVAGEYEIQIHLTRDRDEHVEGLKEKHQLELLIDRARVGSFSVEPPKDKNHSKVDKHLVKRVKVSAGPKKIGVTFVKKASSLIEFRRQPYRSRFNRHRHPRLTPAIYQVSITGPFVEKSTKDPPKPRARPETPSRRRLFVCDPKTSDEEEECAKRILTTFARRAFRRSVAEGELDRPLAFYREARAGGDFDAGIQAGLSAILVSPRFLFRVERAPKSLPAGETYRIDDFDFASRLSFFLWSSIPDDELLALAERGDLRKPEVLETQIARMLADERSTSLVENFAGQWLHLRNLDATKPDQRLFPDFDDNLRRAFRHETELFVDSVFREDRNVLGLLRADYTYLNERLAKHYGVPRVYGSRFRRVELSKESRRGGLLRHGSVLAVTSYATRTSPVIRGHYILKNLLGAPPPPPPPDVPALEDKQVDASLPLRERLLEHRANSACSSCHEMMDPVGFALENFDAVGRWRETDRGLPVDSTGRIPGSEEFRGVAGLEDALLQRPEIFVRTLTEKLLTFALGRGVEYYDAPAVREIVRRARVRDFRFSAILLEIAQSTPFQMRTTR